MAVVVNFPNRVVPPAAPKYPNMNGLNAAPNDQLAVGARGALVSSLQQWLYKRGFNPGDADGIYEDRTAAAVGSLQSLLNGMNGIMLQRTGNFDAKTQAAVVADQKQPDSILKRRMDDRLTQTPQRVTYGKKTTVEPVADPAADPAAAEKTKMWIGVGLGAVGLGLIGWMFLSDKKKGQGAIAGEDFFELGEGGEEDDEYAARSDDDLHLMKSRAVDSAYLKKLADEYADDLSRKVMEQLQKKSARPTMKKSVDGVNDLASAPLTVKPFGQCPVCGKEVHITGRDNNGKLIAVCGDSFSDASWRKKKTKRASNQTIDAVADLPSSSPKGKMQACASQWRAMLDKGGTSYKEHIRSCMKSFRA